MKTWELIRDYLALNGNVAQSMADISVGIGRSYRAVFRTLVDEGDAYPIFHYRMGKRGTKLWFLHQS